MVYTIDRDRVRALQLMQQALDDAAQEPDKSERGTFYVSLADMLMNSRMGSGAWGCKIITDLSKLPDYEDGQPGYYNQGQSRGAPVNADGSPVFYSIPKSWKNAASDGRR